MLSRAWRENSVYSQCAFVSSTLFVLSQQSAVCSLQSAFGTPTSPRCHLGMREAHHSSFSLDGYFGFGIIISEQCQFLLDWYPLQYTSPEWKSMVLSSLRYLECTPWASVSTPWPPSARVVVLVTRTTVVLLSKFGVISVNCRTVQSVNSAAVW